MNDEIFFPGIPIPDRLHRVVLGHGSHQTTIDWYAKAHTLATIHIYFEEDYFTVRDLADAMNLSRHIIHSRLRTLRYGGWIVKKKLIQEIGGVKRTMNRHVYALSGQSRNYLHKYGRFQNPNAPLMRIARRKLKEHKRRMNE